MNEVILLRNGDRVRLEEFPPEHMELLNRRLDQIRDERPTFNDRMEEFLSRPLVATTLLIVGAALIGYAAFTGVR